MSSNNRTKIAYGRGQLVVNLPPESQPTIIRKPSIPKIADPAGAVLDALANPMGASRLIDAAVGKRNACILICDITRPVPNNLFLRPMIKELAEAGMPLNAISRD